MDMRITFPGGKRVDAEFKGQKIRTDQPVAEGGEGSAPEPYSLFLASLGTCAGIYVLGFCQSRGIPTDGIELIQKHHVDTEMHTIDEITIEIVVPKDFPEKYYDTLVRVANKCAVKRSIIDPPEMIIKVVTG